MLAADNGISTSHFQLYTAGGGGNVAIRAALKAERQKSKSPTMPKELAAGELMKMGTA